MDHPNASTAMMWVHPTLRLFYIKGNTFCEGLRSFPKRMIDIGASKHRSIGASEISKREYWWYDLAQST